jgi:tetratricopeptide (TPR) repeat protein
MATAKHRPIQMIFPVFDSCNNASDMYKSWGARGDVLAELGKYEEAIKSYDRAVNTKPDYYEAWFGRGQSVAIVNKSAIENHETGLSHLRPSTHPEGWGELHRALGKTHYQDPYYWAAFTISGIAPGLK